MSSKPEKFFQEPLRKTGRGTTPEKKAPGGGVFIEGGGKHHEDSTDLGEEQPDTGGSRGILWYRDQQASGDKR